MLSTEFGQYKVYICFPFVFKEALFGVFPTSFDKVIRVIIVNWIIKWRRMQAAIIWFDRKLFHGKKKASLRSEIVTSINNWCAIRIIEQISGPLYSVSGPGSSVVIPTELRAGRSGNESRWERDFPPLQTGPGAHPASCKMGTGSFSG